MLLLLFFLLYFSFRSYLFWFFFSLISLSNRRQLLYALSIGGVENINLSHGSCLDVWSLPTQPIRPPCLMCALWPWSRPPQSPLVSMETSVDTCTFFVSNGQECWLTSRGKEEACKQQVLAQPECYVQSPVEFSLVLLSILSAPVWILIWAGGKFQHRLLALCVLHTENDVLVVLYVVCHWSCSRPLAILLNFWNVRSKRWASVLLLSFRTHMTAIKFFSDEYAVCRPHITILVTNSFHSHFSTRLTK